MGSVVRWVRWSKTRPSREPDAWQALVHCSCKSQGSGRTVWSCVVYRSRRRAPETVRHDVAEDQSHIMHSTHLEEASTHKSAETRAGNVCDSWPLTLTFDLLTQINGFPKLILEHFYVKYGDPICNGFGDIVRKKQTNVYRQKRSLNGGKNHIQRRG